MNCSAKLRGDTCAVFNFVFPSSVSNDVFNFVFFQVVFFEMKLFLDSTSGADVFL